MAQNKIKIGIDLFPKGIKINTEGRALLKYDVFLGFHFMESLETFTIEHIKSCNDYFGNILNGRLSLTYFDNENKRIRTKPVALDLPVLAKNPLKMKAWERLFETDSGKYSIKYSSINAALKKADVQLIRELTNNDDLKTSTIEEYNNTSTNERLYHLNDKAAVELSDISSLDKKYESVQLRAKNISNKSKNAMSLYDSLEAREHLESDNCIPFKQVVQEIVEHPILSRNHFGLLHTFSVPFDDIEIFADDISRVELVLNDKINFEGDYTPPHKVDFCVKDGDGLRRINDDITQPTIAHLDNYKVEKRIIKNNRTKLYHGHANYGIVKFNRDPSSNFHMLLISAVHSSNKRRTVEDREYLVDQREDIECIYNCDIDGLFLYHDLSLGEEKAILESPNYGVIGQNIVVSKNHFKDSEELYSLCSRSVNYTLFGFKNIENTKEEGWINVNTNLLGKDGDKSIQYSDPILFAWDGDNLAIPKPVSQVTSHLEGTSTIEDQTVEAQTVVKKYLSEYIYQFNRFPQPSSNVRFSANINYSFLIKYIGLNGYTIPLKAKHNDIELSISDIRELDKDNGIANDPFVNAWINYKGFAPTPEYFSIQAPLILGKDRYSKDNEKDNHKSSTYGENDSSIIIRYSSKKGDIEKHKTRYIFPPKIELKELEFLGYFEKDKLGYRNEKEYLKMCESYHKKAEKESIFEDKRGKKKFNEKSIDYVADPRARKVMLAAHDWQTANMMSISGVDRLISREFFSFDPDGKYDVFKTAKPGRINVFNNKVRNLSLTLGTGRLRIDLRRGLVARFRMHLFQSEELNHFLGISTNDQHPTPVIDEQIKKLYSEHPFSDFKVCHSTKEPLELTGYVPDDFYSTNGTTALRPYDKSQRDHYYYEFNFNPDPSRIQILFAETSNHIMSDNSYIPNDEYFIRNNKASSNYDRDYLANKEYLNTQKAGSFLNKFDEVPPDYLKVHNAAFEETPELNDDVFRREFGVDCSFEDDIIKETLKPGEYIWTLALNDMVTILYLYGLDQKYHLLISRDGKEFGKKELKESGGDESPLTLIKNETLMLPYNSLFDKEFHRLTKTQIKPSHELRFKYGFEQTKINLCILNQGTEVDLPDDFLRKEDTEDNNNTLFDVIDLPDHKLNADRLSLNPKLNDLICYDNAEQKLYEFDFFPNPLKVDYEPYFIYAQDKYKRHHEKFIHFHAVSKFYGMYKDSKYKHTCSSKCKEDFKIEILHNHELKPPSLNFVPLVFHGNYKEGSKLIKKQLMMLMIEMDKFYQNGDQQRLALIAGEHEHSLGQKTSLARQSNSSSRIGIDVTSYQDLSSHTALTNTIDEYLYWDLQEERTSELFSKYREETSTAVLDISQLELDMLKKNPTSDTSRLFHVLNLIPHFLKTREKWIVMLKFKEFNDIEKVYSFFAKIVTATYLDRITDYHSKISNLALPETYPLYNPRVVSFTKTSSSYVIEVENSGVYKVGNRSNSELIQTLYIVCLSDQKEDALYNVNDKEDDLYFYLSSINKETSEEKRYHIIDDMENCRIELLKEKDTRYVYVFEIEIFDNYGVSEYNDQQLGPKGLDKKLREGIVNFMDIRDLRIININQFRV